MQDALPVAPAPASPTAPAGQAEQAEAPAAAAYVLAAQGVQLVEAADDEKEPGAHGEHTEPPAERNEPAAHVHRSVAPEPEAVKPAAQPHVAERAAGATAFASTVVHSVQVNSVGKAE